MSAKPFKTLALLSVVGCSSGNFSGGSGGPASATSSGPSTATSSGVQQAGGNQDCIDGSQVKVEFANKKIQECIDSGKMYNFELNTCTSMRKANFPCNFDSFAAEMKKRGVSSSVFEEGRAKKAFIVACGESMSSQTILIQWFFRPDGFKTNCKFDPSASQIVTGCYGDDGENPEGLSQAQVNQIVLACMNKNSG